MGYDAAVMGNHDIETGRQVFERYAADARYKVLGANIIDTLTGKPFFAPYAVFERGGVKVAVLGLITPLCPYGSPKGCGAACASTIWKPRRAAGCASSASASAPMR